MSRQGNKTATLTRFTTFRILKLFFFLLVQSVAAKYTVTVICDHSVFTLPHNLFPNIKTFLVIESSACHVTNNFPLC